MLLQCTQGSKSSCMRVEWFITYIYLYLPVYLPIYSVRVSLLTCLLRVFAPVNNSAIQYLKAVVLIHFVLNTLNMLNTAQIQFSCSLAHPSPSGCPAPLPVFWDGPSICVWTVSTGGVVTRDLCSPLCVPEFCWA